MLAFLIENLSTIVVSAIVAGVVILIIYKITKDKKSDTLCGVGCNNCPGSSACHK